MEQCPVTVSAAGQTSKETDRFVYLGRTVLDVKSRAVSFNHVKASPGMAPQQTASERPAQYSVYTGRRGGVSMLRLRSWDLTADHNTKLRGAPQLVPHAVIGWSNRVRTYGPLSYARHSSANLLRGNQVGSLRADGEYFLRCSSRALRMTASRTAPAERARERS